MLLWRYLPFFPFLEIKYFIHLKKSLFRQLSGKKKKRESIISPTFLYLHPFNMQNFPSSSFSIIYVLFITLLSQSYLFLFLKKSLPQFLEIKIRVPEPNQADVLGSLHVKIPTESDQSAAISIRECQQSLPNPDIQFLKQF